MRHKLEYSEVVKHIGGQATRSPIMFLFFEYKTLGVNPLIVTLIVKYLLDIGYLSFDICRLFRVDVSLLISTIHFDMENGNFTGKCPDENIHRSH